jgi:hypothetical protein
MSVLTFSGFILPYKVMGRPPKDDALKMTIPLRIMLTADQKNLIGEAARLEGVDMTAWARPILLQAARQRVGPAAPPKPPKKKK